MSLVGIDPGWVNLGLAVLLTSPTLDKAKPETWKFDVLETKVLCPRKSSGNVTGFCNLLFEGVLPYDPERLTMERYVSYKGVSTAEAENILMLIGSLRQAWPLKSQPALVRAIDWKVPLVQILNKYCGFDNESPDLKKGFSLQAAAHLCPGYRFETDHEADAACIAAFPLLSSMARDYESGSEAGKRPGTAAAAPRGVFVPSNK